MAKPAPKPGRNDPCHCGSGNKYKKCCLAKDEAAERDSLVKAKAQRDQPTVAHRHECAAAYRLPVDELMAEVAARLSISEEEDAYEDELDAASNIVVHLVRAAGGYRVLRLWRRPFAAPAGPGPTRRTISHGICAE
jgi:hypothetical protein